MGNLEKPLTWGLVIVLLGYLFIANCDCGEEASCRANNDFNIEFEDDAVDVKLNELKVEVYTTNSSPKNANIDSALNVVLDELAEDSTIKALIKGGDLDTTIIESTINEDGENTEKKVVIIKRTDE